MSEEIHDPSWYIFECRFMAKVPSIALLSDMDLRLHGTPSTGVRKFDQNLRGEMTQAYLSIAELCDISSKGHYVGIVQETDCKRIYEYVQNHLTSWVNKLGSGLNNPNGPFEDLLKLDEFATKVFAHARHQYYDASNSLSPFLQQIENLGMLGEFSIFKPKLDARASLKRAEEGIPEGPEPDQRAPMSDVFQAALLR